MRNLALSVLGAVVGASALAASGLPVFAALAPNYQRLVELRAVLSHPSVAAAFKVSQPIDKVEYLKPDLYRVTAGACHIDVRIVSIPTEPGIVGPRQFAVEPGKPVCP